MPACCRLLVHTIPQYYTTVLGDINNMIGGWGKGYTDVEPYHCLAYQFCFDSQIKALHLFYIFILIIVSPDGAYGG